MNPRYNATVSFKNEQHMYNHDAETDMDQLSEAFKEFLQYFNIFWGEKTCFCIRNICYYIRNMNLKDYYIRNV